MYIPMPDTSTTSTTRHAKPHSNTNSTSKSKSQPHFITADRAARYHAPHLFSDHIYVPPIPSNPYDECVYDLMPLQINPPKPPPTHVSKYHARVHLEYLSGTHPRASMGPPPSSSSPFNKVDPLNPRGYLKKGEGEKKKPTVVKVHAPKVVLKAPLTKEFGLLPTPSLKDFVKINRRDIVHSHPPPPPPAPRCYRRKKNYGCPPQYPIASPVTSSGFITSHGSGGPPPHGSSLSSSSSSLSSATPSGSEGVPPDLELPEDQRLLLLKGLKTNWEKMNSEYQKLSLTVDTVPKITR
ncbi:hypothetical protein HMI56_004158 [Coelomomyces lativittatus]|nr:hypothetical protein HMI56_004158 [Coelomomyces lativittatus]